ncbi:MAG: 3-deoxy-D-manno-octulosonic acid transferase [SAR86 cluster bacterium]|uniref:3-deoxy-D-manno-octulosonic acid transferase n=1 Tax=SAR86 cluster bacterium TaxID=2030880 RepID=A0A2A5B280_9GAMM|nr:MAG: 3-deoxy-D-manno-octulosonic acid transferase [SAR86 cluster bacterium]
MFRVLYSVIFYLAMPVVLLRLLVRSIKTPNYRHRVAERFAFNAMPAGFDNSKQTIWIHSVSVGETVAAAPLINQLQQKYPETQIFISTMTPTGSDRVKELFGNSVFHSYIPYDLPGASKRIVRKIQPNLLILMETEMWPNLLHYCQKSGAKIVLANARLSEKSANGYARFPGAIKKILDSINYIAAQAQDDVERFIALGVDEARISVSGSLKFNVDIKKPELVSGSLFTSVKNSGRDVLIAASTRDGEEEKVLAAYTHCLRSNASLILLLVPRHPERFDKVARLCQEKGFTLARRSRDQMFDSNAQILLGDSMGEMLHYYGLATIAFVGGSLVNTGCQNVIEPAALGIPIVVGPSQFNFATICKQLEMAGALKTVNDEAELGAYLEHLLADNVKQHEMGEKGRQLVQENQNALPCLLRLLESLYP